MSGESYSLFPTPLGDCAIAWNDSGIVMVRLPSKTESATRAGILRAFPMAAKSSPPPSITEAIEKITAAISGEHADFSQTRLDKSRFTDFQRQVYHVTRSIKRGSTLTYGEVAALSGEPGGAQAVGQTLGANPVPIIIPCHRVIGADGNMIGFSASGGVDTKQKILEIEGVFALDKLPLFSAVK